MRLTRQLARQPEGRHTEGTTANAGGASMGMSSAIPPGGRGDPADATGEWLPPLSETDARQFWKRRKAWTIGVRAPGPTPALRTLLMAGARGGTTPASAVGETFMPSLSTTSVASHRGGSAPSAAPVPIGPRRRPRWTRRPRYREKRASRSDPRTSSTWRRYSRSPRGRPPRSGVMSWACCACAHQVVMGEVEWSPTQARVFAKLLDKCVPDLSTSFAESESRNEDFECMTREELEALAVDRRSERL